MLLSDSLPIIKASSIIAYYFCVLPHIRDNEQSIMANNRDYTLIWPCELVLYVIIEKERP